MAHNQGWNHLQDEPWETTIAREREATVKPEPTKNHINWDFSVKDKVYCKSSNRNGIIVELRYSVEVDHSTKDYHICYSSNDKTEYEWVAAGWLKKGHETIID